MRVMECDKEDELFKALKNHLYNNKKWAGVPEPAGSFLDTCFVAEHRGKVLSRAALFKNEKLIHHGKKLAQVGSFESEKNPEAVQLLMEAISEKSRKEGFDGLIGPMNGSTWNSYRFNCQQKQPFFTEVNHPEYYPKLWKTAGFEKVASYFSSLSEGVEKMTLSPLELKDGLEIRNIEMSKYDQELKKIHQFCLKAFAVNFLYTPIGFEAFRELYLRIKDLLDPSLVFLAETNGELVGLIFCLPDQYRSQKDTVIIKTLARLPDPQFKGLGHILCNALYHRVQKAGYKKVIHAFMYDEGPAREISSYFQGRVHRRYALYSKSFL